MGGLLSSLLAKKPSKWVYYENFFTLVTRKVHFGHLEGFWAKSEESRKMQVIMTEDSTMCHLMFVDAVGYNDAWHNGF